MELVKMKTIEGVEVDVRVHNDSRAKVERWVGKCFFCKEPHSILAREVSREVPGPSWSPGTTRWSPRLATTDGVVLEGESYRPVGACRKGCTSVEGSKRAIVYKKVLGKFKKGKVCNARCMGATGTSCECECAGQNHGGAHGHA